MFFILYLAAETKSESEKCTGRRAIWARIISIDRIRIGVVIRIRSVYRVRAIVRSVVPGIVSVSVIAVPIVIVSVIVIVAVTISIAIVPVSIPVIVVVVTGTMIAIGAHLCGRAEQHRRGNDCQNQKNLLH